MFPAASVSTGAILGGSIFIVPNEGIACSVSQRLIEIAPDRAFLNSHVLTLDQFASELLRVQKPDLRPLSPDLERSLLREVIDELHRKRKLSYFEAILETHGFFESTLNFIHELREAGVDGESLLQRREQWGKAKLRQSLGLFVEFETRTRLHHRVSREDRLRLAGVLWRNHERVPFDSVQRIEAHRFVDLSKLEREFLEGIDAKFVETPTSELNRPVGLQHLSNSLFASTPIDPSESADGLHFIEAPGELGEARLIAREIAMLVRNGVDPGSIVVTAREIESSLDLLAEVFQEYGLPVALDGEQPIQRDPAVMTLLRAFQLLDDDFPFAGTTALLRNRLFSPTWGECRDDPDLPRKSEGLLRLLGESRGRAAYLHAVKIWADSPPEGLEDEQAEETHRLHKIFLARECRAFLQRFFRVWDRFPLKGVPRDWVRHLREFAKELGLFSSCGSDGWNRWWEVMERWASRPRNERGEGKTTRAAFGKLLQLLGDAPLLPHGQSPTNGVRLLAPEQAQFESCRFLFLIGLGEGSFPRLGSASSLIDDSDRSYLASLGISLIQRDERLPLEQKLFQRLVDSPQERLYLSYPAVDQRGQAMLPSSFLLEVKGCFSSGIVSLTHQRMLIEGYTKQKPLSESEFRVQLAIRMRETPSDDSRWSRTGLEPRLIENLLASQRLAQDRFQKQRFCAHDGWLDHPLVRERLRERFSPEKPFSATALETYIYCPFRFFFEHVLRYEELDEPGEQIEQTRRGAAVHRALSRFHAEIAERIDPIELSAGVPELVEERLREAIELAVNEYVERAPGAAAKVLWRLEGRRLQRQMSRYRGQWDKFLEPWRKDKIIPRPLRLEAGFGLADTKETPPLVLRIGDIEVRIGGRIDRIDSVDFKGEKGFWIIDYKTGRSINYTASDLKRFEKLQLPLYAMAVERIFFPDQSARPFGLAYWLVTEDGPKIVLPDSKSRLHEWFQQPKKWAEFRDRLESWVVEVVGQIRQGRFPLAPIKRECTLQCNFSHVCRINQSRSVGKTWELVFPVLSVSGGE